MTIIIVKLTISIKKKNCTNNFLCAMGKALTVLFKLFLDSFSTYICTPNTADFRLSHKQLCCAVLHFLVLEETTFSFSYTPVQMLNKGNLKKIQCFSVQKSSTAQDYDHFALYESSLKAVQLTLSTGIWLQRCLMIP